MKWLRRLGGCALLLAAAVAAWLAAGFGAQPPGGVRPRSAPDVPAEPAAGTETVPRVTRLAPAPGARLSDAGPTRIAAHVAAGRGGVDPAGLALRVDGLDVTDDVRFDGGELQYHEYLPAGAHTVELLVRDRAGQLRRTEWQFAIVRGHWSWPLAEYLDEDFEDEGWPFWGLPRH